MLASAETEEPLKIDKGSITLSPRESREHQPQGLHNRRGGMVGKLNDPKAEKKPLRCDWNAVTARLGDACEADLSGYFPQDLQGQILERPIRARGRAGARGRDPRASRRRFARSSARRPRRFVVPSSSRAVGAFGVIRGVRRRVRLPVPGGTCKIYPCKSCGKSQLLPVFDSFAGYLELGCSCTPDGPRSFCEMSWLPLFTGSALSPLVRVL